MILDAVMEEAISPWLSASYYCRMVLETQMWEVCVLIATPEFFFNQSLLRNKGNISTCVKIYT